MALPFLSACAYARHLMATKKALGKGLGALIKKQPGATEPPKAQIAEGDQVQRVDITSVVPSPLQPRKRFSEEALAELQGSIAQHGIIQPLIVRKVDGKFELIAGERRWRASQLLELTEVPIIVRTATDIEVLEMALIENLQRQDLSPIEEAHGYVRLAKEFSMKQEEIAKRVGKSRASVANAMRLLDLHDDIQELVAGAQLSVGHAKAILSLKDHKSQLAASSQILKKGLTVRAAEKLVQSFHADQTNPKPAEKNALAPAAEDTPEVITTIANSLQKQLSTQVTIQHTKKKGKIEIEYYGNEDLQRILELLGLPTDSLTK